jgi:hypothetical protein
MVPYSKLLLTYANGKDKLLMSLGYFFALATGCGIPAFTYLMGNFLNSFAIPDPT